jgi:hypothetical protein
LQEKNLIYHHLANNIHVPVRQASKTGSDGGKNSHPDDAFFMLAGAISNRKGGTWKTKQPAV